MQCCFSVTLGLNMRLNMRLNLRVPLRGAGRGGRRGSQRGAAGASRAVPLLGLTRGLSIVGVSPQYVDVGRSMELHSVTTD